MIRHLILGAGAIAGMGLATVPAQAQSNDRILMVFGNDKCPANTSCIRAPESERYRIPKTLRQETPSANNQRWADRAKGLETAGAAGTGSCSATGAGGWTGCWGQQMRNYKATRAADAEAAQEGK